MTGDSSQKERSNKTGGRHHLIIWGKADVTLTGQGEDHQEKKGKEILGKKGGVLGWFELHKNEAGYTWGE